MFCSVTKLHLNLFYVHLCCSCLDLDTRLWKLAFFFFLRYVNKENIKNKLCFEICKVTDRGFA